MGNKLEFQELRILMNNHVWYIESTEMNTKYDEK